MARATICPLCGLAFELSEDAGTARPPFPSDWRLWVAHDHDQDPPRWTGVLFHHSARERYPEEAKAIKTLQGENRKRIKTLQEVHNASIGKRKGGIG